MKVAHQRSLPALLKRSVALLASCLLLTCGLAEAQAQGRGKGQQVKNLTLVPTITEVSVNDDGQLVASGEVSLENKGKSSKVSFDDVGIQVSLAEDQTGATDCPYLDITLDPINLDLRGVTIETGPICLNITGYTEGGELGTLLCTIADTLDPENPLDPADLTDEQVDDLVAGLEDLFNTAMESLSDAELVNIERSRGRNTASLSFELEPADTTLLGLDVAVDDCEDGPVTLNLNVRRGTLLGNNLSGLLKKGGVETGDTLGDLVESLQNRR